MPSPADPPGRLPLSITLNYLRFPWIGWMSRPRLKLADSYRELKSGPWNEEGRSGRPERPSKPPLALAGGSAGIGLEDKLQSQLQCARVAREAFSGLLN